MIGSETIVAVTIAVEKIVVRMTVDMEAVSIQVIYDSVVDVVAAEPAAVDGVVEE